MEISRELLEKYSRQTSEPNVTYVDFRGLIEELQRPLRIKQHDEISHQADHLPFWGSTKDGKKE